MKDFIEIPSNRDEIRQSKSLVPGERPQFHTNNGDHKIKLSIEVDYLLEKRRVPLEPAQKPGHIVRDIPKKKPSIGDEYRRFFITYTIGHNHEGKTDILPFELASWGTTHEIDVNSEFVAGIFERSADFTIWEVVKNDDKELSKAKTHKSSKFGSRTRLFPLTSKNRQNSIDALNKRRFNLANTGLSFIERRDAYKRANENKKNVPMISTLAEELAKMAGMVKAVGGDPNSITALTDENGVLIYGEYHRGGVEKEFLNQFAKERVAQAQQSTVSYVGSRNVEEAVTKARQNKENQSQERRSNLRTRAKSPTSHNTKRDAEVRGNGQLRKGDQFDPEKIPAAPHQYDHPDKYAHNAHAGAMGSIYRSRSALSLADFRCKEGPSPHHNDHPMLTLFPRGHSRTRRSQSSGRAESPPRGGVGAHSEVLYQAPRLSTIDQSARNTPVPTELARSQSADRVREWIAGTEKHTKSSDDESGNVRGRGRSRSRQRAVKTSSGGAGSPAPSDKKVHSGLTVFGINSELLIGSEKTLNQLLAKKFKRNYFSKIR